MPITTIVVSSNPTNGEVYSIQHYVIKLVSDLKQLGGFLRFPPPIKRHDITEILLKVALNTRNQPTNLYESVISHWLYIYIHMLNDIFTAIISCTILPCQNHGQCQSNFCACTPNFAGYYCESMYYYIKKTFRIIYVKSVIVYNRHISIFCCEDANTNNMIDSTASYSKGHLE